MIPDYQTTATVELSTITHPALVGKFQAEPPEFVTRAQILKIGRAMSYLKHTDCEVFTVDYSNTVYRDGSIFVAVRWKDATLPAARLASIMRQGSVNMSVGKRGGNVEIFSYYSGLSDSVHNKTMAELLAAHLGGKVSSRFI